MIKLNHVSRLYPAKAEANGGVIRALDDFSLNVDPGEWIAIMGPSGSGKSTLVNLIGCLDRPSSGEIWLDGEDVARISPGELNRVRAEKIGFVFQQFHLIPYLTALENVMLAQYFHSMTDEQEALEALQRVGLKERAHHVPVAALWRRTAARLHRARPNQRSQNRPCRRAYWKPRRRQRRDCLALAARTAPARTHHRDGDARPRRRPPRRPPH